jgi:hypothetical protein
MPVSDGRDVQVAFTEGFADDSATIEVDGREVARVDGLRTRYQVGYARIVPLTLRPGAAPRLDISMPERGLHAQVSLDPMLDPLVVRVTRAGDALVAEVSDEPLRFA